MRNYFYCHVADENETVFMKGAFNVLSTDFLLSNIENRRKNKYYWSKIVITKWRDRLDSLSLKFMTR